MLCPSGLIQHGDDRWASEWRATMFIGSWEVRRKF